MALKIYRIRVNSIDSPLPHRVEALQTRFLRNN
jgi:hypothetical protein